MPIRVISVSGIVTHMRPLPSDSTMLTTPFSATPKLAPEMATFAFMNCSRRNFRDASASSGGSASRESSVSGILSTKMSRISARLRWMAGTRMCDGLSSPSWTISSARSVSWAWIPALSRCSLRPVSWVAIDFTLTTSVSPVSRTRSVIISLASLASRAQWTTPPRAVTASSNCSKSSGMLAMTDSLSAEPAARSSSQSPISLTTFWRLARMLVVACCRLRRWVALLRSTWAFSTKPRSPRRLP